METKLSDYDDLECPGCDEITKPKKVKKNLSVIYECKECETKFTIDKDGNLIE